MKHRSQYLRLSVALVLATAAALTASSVVQASPPNGAGSAAAPITITGFSTPESVLYDAKHDVYLVSNINGGGLAADNNGFISRLSPSGAVLDLKWIAGGVNGVSLDAPKGSAIANGTLYVADINNLRLFDAATGRPSGSINFPGATFLNDVAADERGNVFVSDIGFKLNAAGTDIAPSGTDAIYRVSRSGVVSVVAKGTQLNHPNGLAALDNGKLQVLSFDPFGGTKEIYTVDRKGRKRQVTPMPAGLLDGVVVLDEQLLVSSWETSSIYSVDEDGNATVVASGLTSPADIGFDTKRGRILVPLLNLDTVVIQPFGSGDD